MSEDRVRQGDLVLIQLPIRPTHQHLQMRPGAGPPVPGDEALVTHQTHEGTWIQHPTDGRAQWRMFVSKANEGAVFCRLRVIDPGLVLFFPIRKLGKVIADSESAGETPTSVPI